MIFLLPCAKLPALFNYTPFAAGEECRACARLANKLQTLLTAEDRQIMADHPGKEKRSWNMSLISGKFIHHVSNRSRIMAAQRLSMSDPPACPFFA